MVQHGTHFGRRQVLGVPGFFEPHVPPVLLQPAGTPSALGVYDTSPLEQTLERLIDFDLINTRNPRHKVQLSVGAVSVTTGDACYFDSGTPKRCGPIGPRHIMASGALSPGFPPIEIEGDFYWDGGLVSNTPLDYVLDQPRAREMLALQVDLFSMNGPMPRDLDEAGGRAKNIIYAGRTRVGIDSMACAQALGAAARRLAAKLPPELAHDPDLLELTRMGSSGALTIAHLIYRSGHRDTESEDHEFSRQAMREHWQKGADDVRAILAHPDCRIRGRAAGSVTVLGAQRQ
jgi:NTE family protein